MFAMQFRKNNIPEELGEISEKKVFSEHRCLPFLTIERNLREKVNHVVKIVLLGFVVWNYPLEVNSSKDFSNPFTDLEEQRQGDNVPNPSYLSDISNGKLSFDQRKDIGVPNNTRTGQRVNIPEKLNL
ncbi:hypothetical protein CEXT_677871 [Caerostris extrusa]|uniref:Uncharacterized protein n=1 Tax=Caerostris extrusa TaxID=172846 RepID=A0AAV4RAR8_CAEEX|nr:hypothetical protein CEXT_677871 [Caerostris extrusa]